MTYHLKQFMRGLWHVVDESGHPVYDGERDGNDRPIVFNDEDAAWECAKTLTAEKP